MVVHNPGTVILGIFLVVVIFQLALLQWRKHYKSSFLVVSLLGLWLVPFLISIYHGYFRFLAIWTIYSIVNGYVLRLTMQQVIDPSTPR